jgi:hypothetical protein
MQEKLFISSPVKRWVRYVAIAVGLLVVIVGLADVTSRLAEATLGEEAIFSAFAPAAAIR